MAIEKINGFAVVKKDGWKRAIHWTLETRIIWPEIVELVSQDMFGDADDEVKKATRNYMVKFIKGWNELIEDPRTDGVKVKDLEAYAWGFFAGYEACLKVNQKLYNKDVN